MSSMSEYWHYTGPRRVEKAVHTLEGILQGIAIDREIVQGEVELLAQWLGENAEFAERHPFCELLPVVRSALADGILDEEEKQDILWLCGRYSTDGESFSAVTSDMQRLHGILVGIAADGLISKEELVGLQTWMDEHEHLRTCYPYDELEAIILAVLSDGQIDEREHNTLLAFFTEFMDLPGHRAIRRPPMKVSTVLSGVCAVCPDLEFGGKVFCLTGRSQRMSRDNFAELVLTCGGEFSRNLTKRVHYLIVGADGNPCWAFAAYGRKVEQAIRYRKEGSRMLIVHENDFWGAVEDLAC